MSLCGCIEEFAGDWLAGCVDRNGQVRLEELQAHWMPFDWAFSATPLVYALINLGGRIYGIHATL